MQNSITRYLSLILIFAIVFLLVPAGTIATPSSKRAKLARLKNQVDSINEQIDTIDEEYLQAKIRLNQIKSEYTKNKRLLHQAQKDLVSSRKVLSKRIRAMYMQGNDYSIDVILSTRSFNELLTNINFMERIGTSDSLLVKKVFSLRNKLKQAKARTKSNLAYQKRLVRTIANKKIAIEAEIERKQRLIGNLQADLRSYEQAQERRQLALSAQIAPSIPAPTNAPRSQVVQIAMRYLGVPYRWGGASPSTGFDCSGFTMYVYAQVGISLPHSSRAQFGIGQAVPQSALQPGDLVFRGNPGIHHVGIYIGGGQIISAPQTGDVVKIGPAFTSHYAGARRP